MTIFPIAEQLSVVDSTSTVPRHEAGPPGRLGQERLQPRSGSAGVSPAFRGRDVRSYGWSGAVVGRRVGMRLHGRDDRSYRGCVAAEEPGMKKPPPARGGRGPIDCRRLLGLADEARHVVM